MKFINSIYIQIAVIRELDHEFQYSGRVNYVENISLENQNCAVYTNNDYMILI